jgi:hypothetical protein
MLDDFLKDAIVSGKSDQLIVTVNEYAHLFIKEIRHFISMYGLMD